jgi:hypothetical protein
MPPYSDPRIISASTGQLFETIEGLLGRTLSDSERISFTTRLAGINTTLVAPGDLITADLFNALRADISDLSLRLAKLEESKNIPPKPNEEAARILTSKKDALVKGGFQAIALKNPSIIQPGGQAYEPRSKAKCLQDLNLYIDAIIESIKNRDTDKLGEVMSQIEEVNKSLNFSNNWILEYYIYIKNNHGITAQAADIANSYIDYAIGYFS